MSRVSCPSESWILLRSQLPDSLGGERWSALVLGRNLGLLSVKLASGYPNATIVSLKRAGDYTEAHLSLLSLFKLRNNLLCDGELGAEVPLRLVQVDDVLRVLPGAKVPVDGVLRHEPRPRRPRACAPRPARR